MAGNGKKENKTIHVRADAASLKGNYTNMASLNVNDYECVLDFFRLEFGQKDGKGNVPAEHVAKMLFSHKFLPQLAELINKKLEKAKTK